MVSLSDVLPFFTKPPDGEDATSFTPLHSGVAALLAKLQAPSSTDSNMARLSELHEAASRVVEEVMRGTLDHAIPWSRRGELSALRHCLRSEAAGIQVALRQSEPGQLDEHCKQASERLEAILDSIRALEVSVLSKKLNWRRALGAVISIPLVMSAIAGLYLAMRSGFVLQSSELHFPFQSCSTGQSSPYYLAISDSDRDRMLREFSGFYFKGTGNFRRHFLEKPIEPRTTTKDSPGCTYRIKFDIRNQRRIGTTQVSAVSVHFQLLQEQSFPWGDLDVTPQIQSYFKNNSIHYPTTPGRDPSVWWSPPTFYLNNIGIGPALNVRSTIKLASGQVLITSHASMLQEDASVPLPKPGSAISPWPLRIARPREKLSPREFTDAYQDEPWQLSTRDRSPELLFPMYARLSAPPPQPVTTEVFEHNDEWYRTITTVDQLKKNSEVFLNQDILLLVEYESLAGQKYELRHTEPAQFGWCYYRRGESLLEFDPRVPRVAPFKAHGKKAAAPSGVAVLDMFAAHFAPPSDDPKGVDHVTLESEVDLTGVREGEQVGQVLMVDKFLNPSGTICVYAKIYGQRTGRWQARISIDGDVVDVVEFDAIVPEVMQFPRSPHEQYVEIERLKAHFRAKRNRQ